MSGSVLAKAVRDRLRMVVIVGVGIGLMILLVMPLYNSFGAEYGELVEAFPPEIIAALGAGDLASPVGYLNAEVFSILIPLAVVSIGVVIGVGAIAGEEDRRTLNVLLAAPVRRTQVAWAKALGLVLLMGLLSAFIFAAFVAGNALADLGIATGGLLAGSVMSLLLGVFWGSIAFGVGAATGRSGLAAAIGGGGAIVSWFVHAFAPLVDALAGVQKASPFYWYLGPNPLANGIDPLYAGLLIGVAALAFAGGVVAFDRRDVAS